MKNIKMLYQVSGVKGVAFYFLQKARLSIFWDKDMKHKQNVGIAKRLVGKAIIGIQNSFIFKVQ